jgi:predicted permease
LIVVQVMLAVVLLFGASLFTHSLEKLKVVDLGYDIERVLNIDIAQRGPRQAIKPVVAPPALADVLERVRRLPAVEAAAYSSPGVLSGTYMSDNVTAADPADGVRSVEDVNFMVVGSGYFSSMRMSLLRGREFSPSDRAGAPPVIVVNQRLAAALAPGRDALGMHVDTWGLKNVEIVGVVGNGRYQGVRENARPAAFLAYEQSRTGSATLEVRFRGTAGDVERQVRGIVATQAPGYRVSNTSTMELLRDRVLAQDRLLTFLSSLFGALGTALALVGIYGLIAYSVTRRTREIGIRVSVGAQRSDVLWLFLRESALLVSAGMLLGLPLALVLARMLQKMLYEVSTSDPIGAAATLGLIAAGGLVASLLPARRATRVDPVRALRYD